MSKSLWFPFACSSIGPSLNVSMGVCVLKSFRHKMRSNDRWGDENRGVEHEMGRFRKWTKGEQRGKTFLVYSLFLPLYLTGSFPFSIPPLTFASQFPPQVTCSISITHYLLLLLFLSAPLSASLSVASIPAFSVFFISVQSLSNCRSQQEIFCLWEETAGWISGNIPFYCCWVS